MILRPDICTFQQNCTRPPAPSPVSAANSEPASTTLTHLYELSIESARNSALTAIIETGLVTRIEAYMNVLPQSLTPCSYSLDPNSPFTTLPTWPHQPLHRSKRKSSSSASANSDTPSTPKSAPFPTPTSHSASAHLQNTPTSPHQQPRSYNST